MSPTPSFPGPTASFGKTEISGLTSVNHDFIEKRLAWKQGERYDSRKVNSTQQTLIASNLFATVRITPADKVSPDGQIAMRIAVTERRPRSIGAGLYYDSSLGFGGKAFWEHRNLFGEGELLHIEGTAGQSDYGLLAQFKRPAFLMLGLDLRSEASIGRLMTDAYDTRQAKFFTGLDYQIDSQITTGVGAEVLNGRVDDDTGNSELYPRRPAGLYQARRYRRSPESDAGHAPRLHRHALLRPRRQQSGFLSGQAQRQRLSEPRVRKPLHSGGLHQYRLDHRHLSGFAAARSAPL